MSSGSTNIPIEREFISNGYGYVTIPSDTTRDSYLKDFYRTGLCIILTTYNETKRRVSIPKHLINEIEFPNIPGDKGSLIHWQRVPGTGQLVVTGIHLTTVEFTSSSETQRVDTKSKDGSVISVIKNLELNGYSVTVVGNEDKPGEINFIVSDNSGRTTKVNLNGGGALTVETSNTDIKSKSINIVVDKDKSIVFDDDEFTLNYNGQKIKVENNLITIDSDKLVSVSSKDSSVNLTPNGVVIETDHRIFVNGSLPVLYSKVETATEILDLTQIGVSNSVRVGK